MTWSYSQQPPDSSGKKILTYLATISAVDYHVQQVQQYRLPTFACQSTAAALQTTSSMFAVNNITGSGLDVQVLRCQVQSYKAAGYAGTLCQMRYGRGSGTVTGTASQVNANDSGNTTPASTVIAVVMAPTSLGAIFNLGNINYNTASQEQAAAQLMGPIAYGNWIDRTPPQQPVTIHANEFFAVNAVAADASSSVIVRLELAITPA